MPGFYTGDQVGFVMRNLFRNEAAKTANYTVTAAWPDLGALFTNSGATGPVTFTLPGLKNGLVYGFRVRADQNMTIAAGSGDSIEAPGNASATQLSFVTPGSRVGGMVLLYANQGATRWYCEVLSPNALTVT
jgi:hypothetical protein